MNEENYWTERESWELQRLLYALKGYWQELKASLLPLEGAYRGSLSPRQFLSFLRPVSFYPRVDASWEIFAVLARNRLWPRALPVELPSPSRRKVERNLSASLRPKREASPSAI